MVKREGPNLAYVLVLFGAVGAVGLLACVMLALLDRALRIWFN